MIVDVPPGADSSSSPSMVVPDDAVDVAAVEAILGYEFADKAPLEAGLTHASFRGGGGESSFERHEFLGDRVVGYLVARHMFAEHLTLPLGALTRLVEVNVDNEKLARAAVAHDLHRFFRHNLSCPLDHITDFTAEIADYPVHFYGLVTTPEILADIVESIMAAVDIDSDHDKERLWKVFRRLADPLIGPETMGQHPMSELMSMCPKAKIKEDWKKSKTFRVVVDGETLSSATYHKTKMVARNRAVKSALDTIKFRKMAAVGDTGDIGRAAAALVE